MKSVKYLTIRKKLEKENYHLLDNVVTKSMDIVRYENWTKGADSDIILQVYQDGTAFIYKICEKL